MQQNEWLNPPKQEKKKQSRLTAPLVQCVVCAILVLSVFGLSRSGSAAYARLRAQYQSWMAQDYCADGVWTAAKRAAQDVLEPQTQTEPQSAEAVARVDARAPVETVTSSGGEDIRVLDALQDSSFAAVTVSQRAVMPVQGTVTSGFGYRIHHITGNRSFHTGIDLAAAEGTGVAAAYGGKVIEAGYTSGRGNYILIEHSDSLQTLYCHLSRIDAETGDTVGAGDTIGLVGSTGMSTGPHLHFEVRVDGIRCDPAYVLEGLEYA